MHPHERDVLVKVGPHFERRADGEVLFSFVVDPNNIVGPRKATEADKQQHAEAWARFEREQGETHEHREVGVTWSVSETAEPEAPPAKRKYTRRAVA